MSAHEIILDAVPTYNLLRSAVEREQFITELSDHLKVSVEAVSDTIVQWSLQRRHEQFIAAKKNAIAKAKTQLNDGAIEEVMESLKKFLPNAGVIESTGFEKISIEKASLELAQLGDPVVTGFPTIDSEIQITRGTLTAIGGRPGEGKTSWGLSIAYNVAKMNPGYDVLLVSTEMQMGLLTARMVAQKLEFTQTAAKAWIVDGKNSQSDAWEDIESFAPAVLCDENIGVGTICKAIEAYASSHKGRHLVVIVDYLTNVRADEKAERRDIEVGSVIQSLRKVASQLNAAMIVLAQLNRDAADKSRQKNAKDDSKNDTTTTPALHHFRESGVIEAEASVAFAIWNPNPALPRQSGFPSKLRIKCLKNRYGASGQEFDVYLSNPGGLIYEKKPERECDDIW